MSSGGKRGIDASGITALRVQDAGDATTHRNLQLIYQNFASTVGANAYANRTPNSYGDFLKFTQGRKEQYNEVVGGTDCSACIGLPYTYSTRMNFR